MSTTVQRKKHRLDRYDGWYIQGLDSLHVMMPYMFGPRTKNESVGEITLDLTKVDEYLAKKNADGPDFKYTLFHFTVAALAKAVLLRPKMNYFISGHRFYERKQIQIAFVVKREFSDKAEESEAKFVLDRDGGSPVDQVHDYVKDYVRKVRTENKTEGVTNALNAVKKFPRPLFRLMAWALNRLEYHGHYPKGLAKDDPCYSSIFVTNLGSIKMSAHYHHLFDWGTNSFFAIINEKKMRPFFNPDGTYDMRDSVKLAFVLDERIADGYYFSKTFQLLQYMFEHPELLDEPVATPINQ